MWSWRLTQNDEAISIPVANDPEEDPSSPRQIVGRSLAMATPVHIQCINKSDRPNPHERILNVGGISSDGRRWRRSQQQAITDIENGTYSYFFAVAGAASVWVIVAVSRLGHKYIKTTADRDHPNNLLTLPECPP
jgi:hypothetical protein